MANLSESATYDAGVYQLETTDPVAGGAAGISNSPLKNLANRTAYLKQHIDALEVAAGGYAPLSSPGLTGSPTAPTQALGDNSTKIATDAFVQATVGGRLAKSVSGGSNVTLTAVEAGNAILEFSGVLTASIAVIVPTSPTRSWIVKNATSGAYTLTVKTAAGTGVVCTQGKTAGVFTDGTNVYDSLTDFDSPALTGDPTAPTPAQFDNDTSVATTEFVQRALGSFSNMYAYNTNQSLTASHIGKHVYLYGAVNGAFTLPPLSGIPAGSVIVISNFQTSNTLTVQANGAESMLRPEGTTGSVTINGGESITCTVGPSSVSWMVQGTGVLKYSGSFGSSLAASGYQKLPSGLIEQWIIDGSAFTANVERILTLPISFLNSAFSVLACAGNSVPNAIMTFRHVSSSQIGIKSSQDISNGVGVSVVVKGK